MLRLRFAPGLILGLLLGLPSGVLIAILALPPTSAEHGNAAAIQIEELNRKLETAREDRQRVDRQLEQFQKLAEQMTTTFNNLETRFKLLEEEQRIREAREIPAPVQRRPTAIPTEIPTPAAPAATPTAVPPPPAADRETGDPAAGVDPAAVHAADVAAPPAAAPE